MAYEVQVKELFPQKLASIRAWYPAEALAQIMAHGFEQIVGSMAAQGLHPAGPPVAVYHAWTEDSVDLELGFPVADEFKEAQGVKPGELPGGRAAFTIYVGPYDQIEPAYHDIQVHAEKNGLTLAPVMWERYLTNPAEEPDLSKHLTEVCWPLV